MPETRIQFNNIVQNQLPVFTQSEFPLVSEFLKSYYQGQEYQGGPIDLIQNIDEYVKIENITNLTESVGLRTDVTISDETIEVDMVNFPRGTDGFPKSYGLLKIDNEIITYTGITTTSFTGCVRGFCGITSYKAINNPDVLVFNSSTSEGHTGGSKIQNLSSLFLKEFLLKTKHLILPGLENRSLDKDLDQNLFIKQSKDFYLSKGTDRSFEILFKALYNQNVQVIKPRDFLLTPSNANFKITNDIVVEPVQGDPRNLENSTLFQGSSESIDKAYAPVGSVEPINVGVGETYYKISFDSGYDRDIRVRGAIYGNFVVHDKTKNIGVVSIGATVVDVDSTIGFPDQGELKVVFTDATNGIVSYTSKSVNQFYGCSGVTAKIADASNIGINTYAFGTSNLDSTDEIRVNITAVLNELEISGNTHNFSVGETAEIKTLGVNDDSFIAKNWFYNLAPTLEVKEITLVDATDQTYRIEFFVEHAFKNGDTVTLDDTAGNELEISTLINIDSETSITLKGQGLIDTSLKYIVKRNISKAVSNTFPDASIFSTNVQNLYKDGNKYLVASSSIPTYNAQPLNVFSQAINFGGTFSGSDFKIIFRGDHGFHTGDAVYYSPQRVPEQFYDANNILSTRDVIKSSLFSEDLGVIEADEKATNAGLYFIKRVNALTIKLSRSRTDLENSNFISIETPVTIEDNIIQPFNFEGKTLQSQDIFREISPVQNDGLRYDTEIGFTGILINGVEILNYKSKDVIYFGQLDRVEVLSGGTKYDVINPPNLTIKDNVGTGATGYVSVSGAFEEIRVVNSGFDYVDTPVVSINGGNGKDAVATVNTKLIEHQVSFNSQSTSAVDNNTIGFSTFHKFRNAEAIIYETKGQRPVGGISTDAVYFASVVDTTNVKLHLTERDAIAGINTVQLTSLGVGRHDFKTTSKKSVVESINIISSGSGYANNKVTSTPAGINTSSNIISISEHGYNSGEIIKYTAAETPVGGLSDKSEYFVTKIDDHSFKLSAVGIDTGNKQFFYDTKQYVNLTSVGLGTHTFNYQDINVSISGQIGISTAGFSGDVHEIFGAKIEPIIRGEIKSIHLFDNGENYGDPEILNFNRRPNIILSSGKNAQLSPIIVDGKIVEVLVQNSGDEYNSSPNINIFGSGIGAVLTPIIENNKLISVKVIESGIGYTQNDTKITITPSGVGAKFRPIIQTWRVNLFEKYFNTFTEDDGFLSHKFTPNKGLQYSHLYAPRKLRESVFQRDQAGRILFGKPDLTKINGIENVSDNHSPIIGWAYDGNPIYGPYGYTTNQGGVISQLKSGYSLKLQPNRPSVSIYPLGFFVNDFSYKKVKDESVLDENNGRFCVTPEFPKGTYAYFTTLEPGNADSAGTFDKFKRPVFPYLIGNTYQSIPNNFNFSIFSNQTDFNLDKSSFRRNTTPYNLIENQVTRYNYAYVPDNLSQKIDVKSILPGVIEKIGIETSGESYQVGDSIVFEKTEQGFGANVIVSDILGKSINQVSGGISAINNTEIYPNSTGKWDVICDSPHNFNNLEIVVLSGLSTTSSGLEGDYDAGISTSSFALTGIGTTTIAVENVATTGVVTFFNLSGNFEDLTENDILEVGDENIKVLNVEKGFSRVRALRGQDATVGIQHTVTTVVNKKPRIITINAGIETTSKAKRNKEIYFNPIETVAQGTGVGVGIGSTIFFNRPGVGVTSLFIPTKSIFLKNHGLETGDQLTYFANSGTPLKVNNGSTSFDLIDSQTLFAAKITSDLVGVATVRVGLGTTGGFVGVETSASTLAFSGIGTGVFHSLKTNHKPITGTVTRNLITVSAGSSHGLVTNDKVIIDVNPSVAATFNVSYNDFNRRIIINPRDFADADINVPNDTIRILDHGYSTGQKIIHTAATPISGLSNDRIYYVVVIDTNTIKLSDTYYNSTIIKPIIVNLQNTGTGTINPVNPPIKVFADSVVDFNLSDNSLGYVNQGVSFSAFNFNFYNDRNLTKQFNKTKDSDAFEVKQTGAIGITSDAKISLTVNNNIPKTLFYKLEPVFEGDSPLAKQNPIIDLEVPNSDEIQVKGSLYNGEHKVTVGVGSTSSFTYTVKQFPERNTYTDAASVLKYTTTSKTAYGAISKFRIKDAGRNYKVVPGISTITTFFGKNAVVSAASTSIGVIKKTEIKNIGFNFPSDTTLSPSVALPQIIDLKSLTSFESIGISSVGRGYSTAPKLLVFDGETKKQITDIDITYKLGDPQVSILKNTTGISQVTPEIIPTQNSNGVGISTVRYNSTTKDVTLTLSVGFSTENSFPFETGDKILIENVSVGIGTTQRGFNSAEYDYELFTVSSVDPNLGGIGIVTFSLANSLLVGEFPGTYDPKNSTAARVIPKKHFPLFDIKLSTNDYFIGEKVTADLSEGIVETWDPSNETLVVSSKDVFKKDQVIKGVSSKTQGVAKDVSQYDASLKIDSFSKVENGWETTSGYLNNDTQRIQDNDYYQNFSYSLKSKVAFRDWDDVVSALNHTLGYKKFADFQLESTQERPISVGLNTETTYLNIVNDLISQVDLNCVNDFDLVKENSINTPSGVISDKIIFSSRILSDYEESIGNRVLSIDDMSGSFNSNPRSTPFSVVDTFPLIDHRAKKYITFVRDKRFTGQRQLMIVDLIHDGSFGYINQYGRIESQYDMGAFDFSIVGSDGQLLFFPNKSTVNDYDIVSLSYNLDDNLASVGSTALGTTLIDSHSTLVPKSNPSTTIVSIGKTYTSAKVVLQITANSEEVGLLDEFEFEELNIVHDGTDVQLLEYGEMTTTLNNVDITGFGTYSAEISGSNFNINFHPNTGIGTTAVVNALVVANSNEAVSAASTIDLKHARLTSRSTQIASSGSPTANVVGSYPNTQDTNDLYSSAYFNIQVTDTTNNESAIAELIVINDSTETYTTDEYAVITTTENLTLSGLGTFHTDLNGNDTRLLFTPLPNTATNVKVFMNALRIEDDEKDVVDFGNNSSIEVESGSYTGTDRDIKRAFNLTHAGLPIFERSFNASNSQVVSTANDTIEIPNHFFVSGEKINYVHAGAGTTQAIGISATNGFVGIGTTDKLPSNVFAVKVDDNKIKIAETAQKALLSIPETVDLTSVGIGTSHRFVSTNQNAKVLLCLDNIIQSPVVATAVTTTIANQVFTTSDIIPFTGITSFFGGDLIRIGSEIMKIEGVGIGSATNIRVRRGWMGTSIAGHSTSSLVTKVDGNYNIVENVLNFIEAPFGNLPLSTSTNPPDSRDWTGISTSSSFQGRSFLRSGIENSSNETYSKNYIFDSVSHEFNGIKKDFVLKSEGSNVSGIANDNAVILVNDVFQNPIQSYSLSENAGITSISFVGTASSTTDANLTSLPLGGVILSVGSTEGFGYQPLVAAGGTAIVSAAGTITSVAIGNSGSGYRSGIQTVNVSIQRESLEGASIVKIGTATISDGHVSSVGITTDHVFYAPKNISNVLYDNTTGITTVTTSANHGLQRNDEIKLSGIVFTCNYSGATSVNVTNAIYNNVTGIMTVTTASAHGLSTTGQRSDVVLAGLAFTCGLDNGSSTHVYPRTTDPVYCGTPVTAVNSATEFEVNAGVSTVPTFYSSGGTAQGAIIAPRAVNNSGTGRDSAFNGTNVLRVLTNKKFVVNTGISTRAHTYSRCGKVEKPLDIIFDNPLSYTGIPLEYSSSSISGVGSDAVVDVVVGQGSSVTEFNIQNTGYGFGIGEILTLPIGGATGIPTTSSYKEFQLTIDEIFSDEFNGWSLGQLEPLDSPEKFFDGETVAFQLEKDGEIVSIIAAVGSKINVQDVILVFVNDVLQVPGKGYTFTGGSIITFTEAPKVGDTCKVIFYKGSGAIDVKPRSVIETVKKGDDLTINFDASIGQTPNVQEEERIVTRIDSTDIVSTNPYFGPGNTEDETLIRPVKLCRQTEDKIINDVEIGKDREFYEPNIHPATVILKSVGIGSTSFFVDNIRPFFNPVNENASASVRESVQDKVTITSQQDKIGTISSATISSGSVTSISVVSSGSGYVSVPNVSIQTPTGIGSTATATAAISNGQVTSISVTYGGTGYTSAPQVLIDPPTLITETNTVSSYNGDSGTVVGFGTTVSSNIDKLIFDFYIPQNSFLRDSDIVGTATTLSGISIGDYFVINNSNIGFAQTSIISRSLDNTIVATGKSFFDNVYQVDSASIVSVANTHIGISTVGTALTSVVRVETRISGISTFNFSSSSIYFDSTNYSFDNQNFDIGGGSDVSIGYTGPFINRPFLGEFSWGRIDVKGRSKTNTYTFEGQNGVLGINTGPLVTRTNRLSFKNYDV